MMQKINWSYAPDLATKIGRARHRRRRRDEAQQPETQIALGVFYQCKSARSRVCAQREYPSGETSRTLRRFSTRRAIRVLGSPRTSCPGAMTQMMAHRSWSRWSRCRPTMTSHRRPATHSPEPEESESDSDAGRRALLDTSRGE
jgi:hypothetical protein